MPKPEIRKLAAIVSIDVVGYSGLMQRDEAGTLSRLGMYFDGIVSRLVSTHNGRVVKSMGDGLLIEFPTAVDAVACALEVQTVMADREADNPSKQKITFRIGVNLGDIVVIGDDIFGDGVNQASRLQEIAKPGELCVSGRVLDQVKDKMIALDTRRKELEAQLAQADASPDPVRLHPQMSETYRERVTALIRGLAESEGMEEAKEAIRGLIEKIVLTPRADGPGLTVDLHGALASLLLLATDAPTNQVARMASKGPNAKTPAGAEFQGFDMTDKLVLVAGVGFEPTTFRL